VAPGRRWLEEPSAPANKPRPLAPFRKHTDVLAEAVPTAGRRALELGCGDGRLLAWLLRRGADAVGLDPDPAQLARAAGALGGPGRLVRGRAERLPFAPALFDLVLCFNSLHHVPVAGQPAALAEAARVLRPGGDLVVVEPLAEGPWFELLCPLEEETEVRARAREALLAAQGFVRVRGLAYPGRVEVPSLAAAVERLLAADPARRGAEAAAMPELERRFAAGAEPVPGGFAFAQPMRLDHLRRAGHPPFTGP
jgi:SAM-dependent methyltransferase